MGKYDPLKNYLQGIQSNINHKSLTFSDLERILGFKLPNSAYDHRVWWSNPTSPSDHPYAQSWIEAGWKVDSVDQLDKRVHFRRTRSHNVKKTSSRPSITDIAPITKKPDDLPNNDLWFWEGNVQSQVVNYLSSLNYKICSVADTASHQQGIDIIAEKDGNQLWVSVKGYPKGTEKTNPSTQAGHWFKQAVFDIINYRGQNKTIFLALAFPDYPRYHYLAKKIAWFKPVANYDYIWVRENGEVVTE